MNWILTIYSAILFFVFTPNVFIKLPVKGSKYLVAFVHAIIFSIIFNLSYNFVFKLSGGGIEGATPAPTPPPCRINGSTVVFGKSITPKNPEKVDGKDVTYKCNKATGDWCSGANPCWWPSTSTNGTGGGSTKWGWQSDIKKLEIKETVPVK
jgi:hypothetical protein